MKNVRFHAAAEEEMIAAAAYYEAQQVDLGRRVLFRDLQQKIVVMVVMHLHRDPDCWKDR